MVQTPDSTHGRGSHRAAFRAGVAVGLLFGLLSLELSPIVLILALPFVPAAILSTPGRVGASAGLIAGGLTWLLLIGLAEARCSTGTVGGSSSTCTEPDVTGWVVAAVVAVGVGLVLGMWSRRQQ